MRFERMASGVVFQHLASEYYGRIKSGWSVGCFAWPHYEMTKNSFECCANKKARDFPAAFAEPNGKIVLETNFFYKRPSLT